MSSDFPWGGLSLPKGRIPHADELRFDKGLRQRLRQAAVVIVIWPNETQELLFGGDYLTHLHALGEKLVLGCVHFRVSTEAQCCLVVDAMVQLKRLTREQVQLMIDGTASYPKGAR